MRILVVVPAYNEESSILKAIDDIKEHAPDCDFIVINDCSKDQTLKVVRENKINCINLPINLGLEGAVQTGYRYAYENNYDACVQFDGDGQHKAKYLIELKQEIMAGNNIVIGSRFLAKEKDKTMRMFGSNIISFLIKVKTGKTISDPTSGMRMIDRESLYNYAYNPTYRPEPDSLVKELKKGKKVKEVQVEMNERKEGTSIYSSPFKAAKYMIKMIISIIFLS